MTIAIALVVVLGILQLVNGQCQATIKNCCQLGYNNNFFNAKSSGVYTISNFCDNSCSTTRLYCDTVSSGGGWTVLQRRFDHSVDFFNRDWVEYEDGFGSIYGEFWLGLRSMYCLTSKGTWELRIDYTLPNGTSSHLHYSNFKVESPDQKYRLRVSGFKSIGLSDPFSYNNGRPFTSRDQDNDLSTQGNCANEVPYGGSGGWWHHTCSLIRLNNHYSNFYGPFWINGVNHKPSLLEMKIRPQQCKFK